MQIPSCHFTIDTMVVDNHSVMLCKCIVSVDSTRGNACQMLFTFCSNLLLTCRANIADA